MMTTATTAPTTARRRRVDDNDKVIGVLVVLIAIALFVVGLMNALDKQDDCTARQCPPNYTPTLTRDGCVCLMKAK